MEYDLILRRAKICDNAQGLWQRDVAIKQGTIAAVEASLPAQAVQELDCDGLLLVPGLIDLHVHAAHTLNKNSLHPDEIGVQTGVTTVVDAGSVGALLAQAFCQHVVPQAVTNVYGFLNIALDTTHPEGLSEPSNVNLSATLKALEHNPQVFRGIKIMASVSKLGLFGIEAVKIAKKAAALAGLPLMVHIGNPPPLIEDVLNIVGKGDIVTHCFHGKPGGLLDRKGRIIPEAWAALERGVKFDIGHGSESFNFGVYHKAVEAGFVFHSISSDLHVKNRTGPVYDLLTTMNKFLALNYPLHKVIAATTTVPAQILRLDHQLGSLKPGFSADLSLLQITRGQFSYSDSDKNTITAGERLEAVHTIKNGQLVWSASPAR